STAKPFLEKWMLDQIGPKKLLEQLKDQAPHYAKLLPQLPRLLHEYLHLWVDDEIDLLKPHILFLEKRNYNVTTCNNGLDAIEIFEKASADELVAMNQALLMSYTLGSLTGPTMTSLLMQRYSDNLLFIMIAGVALVYLMMLLRKPDQQQTPYAAI
ncbi:MAG: hypothetical protein ACEQSN_05195, partial [Yersinia sp. (in: enterobacteria)]